MNEKGKRTREPRAVEWVLLVIFAAIAATAYFKTRRNTFPLPGMEQYQVPPTVELSPDAYDPLR